MSILLSALSRLSWEKMVILCDNPLFLGPFPLEGEGTGSVVSQDQDLLNMDTNWTIDTTPFFWPVFVTFQLQKEPKSK